MQSRGRPGTIAAAKENKESALSTWDTSVTPNDIMTVKTKLDQIMKPLRGDNYALIEQSQYSCQHTCPKGIYGSTPGTSAYGEIVSTVSATREYICSCKNEHNEDCKLSLWFCNEECPFTMFEKHAVNQGVEPSPLAVGWKNPLVFKGQASGRELMGVIGDHVKGCWHCFWHAVSEFTKSGSRQTVIQPADYQQLAQLNKYRITRDLFAFYAMANYQLDDNHVEVHCEINIFILKNALHFKNAEKFLKHPQNPWIPRSRSNNTVAFEDFILLQPTTAIKLIPAIYAFGQALLDNTLNTPKGKHVIKVIHEMYGDTLVAQQAAVPSSHTLQSSGHKHMRAGGQDASYASQLEPAAAAPTKMQKMVMPEPETNRLRDSFQVSPAAVLGATHVCKTADTLQGSGHPHTRAVGEGASLASQVGPAAAAYAPVPSTVMSETEKNRLRDAFQESQAAVLEATKVCKTAEATSHQCATEVQQAMQLYNSAVLKRDASQTALRRAHADVALKTRLQTPILDAYTKMNRQEILAKQAETTQRAQDTSQRTAASTLMMLLQDTSLNSSTSTTKNKTPSTLHEK